MTGRRDQRKIGLRHVETFQIFSSRTTRNRWDSITIICIIQGMTIETASIQNATMIGNRNRFEKLLLKAFSPAGDTFPAFPPLIFQLGARHHGSRGAVKVISKSIHGKR